MRWVLIHGSGDGNEATSCWVAKFVGKGVDRLIGRASGPTLRCGLLPTSID